MARALSDPVLAGLSSMLADRMGLHFPPQRWSDLERGIKACARELGAADAQGCAERLLTGPLTRPQIEVLARHLTIGETYFFREHNAFSALREQIFPELLRMHAVDRQLRIWSAGCCTGEEPYSIAMLLDQLLPEPDRWNVTILATDINPVFLRKARGGLYGEWSFRTTPATMRERYFRRSREGRFQLVPAIRRRVTFSYLNLAEDVYPSLTTGTNAMDLILCRNVLMYFDTAQARKVVAGLARALVGTGWLIVSPVEASSRIFAGFTQAGTPWAALYRKSSGVAPPSRPEMPALTIPQAVPAPPAPPGPLPPPEPAPARSRRAVAVGDSTPVPAETAAAAARRHANAGRLADAAQCCEAAIAADKTNPARYYLLASVRQELGQPAEAVQALQRALYLDPDFVLAHFALGTLRLAAGRRREALRHLENAAALLVKHPPGEALPESEGLTAGRLAEIVQALRLSVPGKDGTVETAA